MPPQVVVGVIYPPTNGTLILIQLILILVFDTLSLAVPSGSSTAEAKAPGFDDLETRLQDQIRGSQREIGGRKKGERERAG